MRRRTQLLAICFTALLLPSPPTHGEEPAPSIAQEVERGHIPEWLAPRAIPEVTPEMARRSRNGISYLITDWQVRGSEAGTDSYYRVAQKVMDRSGLEGAGKIEAEFDPRYEHVTLNYVHVIRDGHTIDRTAEAELKIVQREASLDEGLIYGKFTAIANLKDIRVGDIVDYATTYHSQDKLWPGHFFGSFAARLSDPVGLRAVRIAWPVGYPLTYKTVNSDISFQKKREGNSQILEWVGKDVPEAAEEEKDVPDWFPQYGRVNISTMTTWGEVARWASRFYEGDDTLTPDFEKRLDDIAQRWPDPADRLTEVTRYVQDNIRYVGEEMGELLLDRTGAGDVDLVDGPHEVADFLEILLHEGLFLMVRGVFVRVLFGTGVFHVTEDGKPGRVGGFMSDDGGVAVVHPDTELSFGFCAHGCVVGEAGNQ